MARITPGSPEWHARLDALHAKEQSKPLRWWYISIANDEGFIGGLHLRARGPATIREKLVALGILPAPVETAMFPLPVDERQFPPGRLDQVRAVEDKLLSKAEMEVAFGCPAERVPVGDLLDAADAGDPHAN